MMINEDDEKRLMMKKRKSINFANANKKLIIHRLRMRKINRNF